MNIEDVAEYVSRARVIDLSKKATPGKDPCMYAPDICAIIPRKGIP